MCRSKVIRKNVEGWAKMTEQESVEMPVVGKSPWGDEIPLSVWSWDEETREVLVGFSPEDCEVLSYNEAVRRLS